MSELDPELNDVLGDPELIRLARLLSAASVPEPPLDDAFKSALRRQLMADAWGTADGKNAWWRRVLAPAGLAWIGAAAAVVLVASVVLYTAYQPSTGFTQTVLVNSPQQDSPSVPLHQAILVSFTQPMDHGSTEAAVKVVPATTVAFRWGGDTQLYVQPTNGTLAPNTQYQVTIGSGAQTKAGTPLTTPTTITFVTQPTASPSPPPAPSPQANALGQLQLTSAYPPSGTSYPVVWSADSSTIYFVGAGGTLESVPAKGGATKTLAPDGASLPAIAPAGDRLAYVRGGKIEILTLATGGSTELAVTAVPTVLSWVKDQLLWGTTDGVYENASAGPTRIASLPPSNDPTAAVVSIAPDGGTAVYAAAKALHLLDIASGKSVDLVGGPTTFQAWSPDGSRVVYNSVIADLTGKTITSLAAADVSWSAENEILLGSDTGLFAVRPDGTGLTKLADGTFNQPTWAPDSSTFAFVRAGLWVATAPPPPPIPPVTDQAIAVVNAFMDARLHGNADRATLYLDDAGKAAYNAGNPVLLPSADAGFKRYYVLMSEVDPSTTNSVRVVVRLVFAKGKVETSAVEETLTLKRAQATDPFLIDGAAASPQRDLGKGPEVVAVKITATEIDVTFDSDLVPGSVGGVMLQDSQGLAVTSSQTYADRTVVFTGLQLNAGAHYRLVVLPSVQDVGNRHTASEYDLDLLGPAPDATSGGATPSPSPAQSPSPGPSPSPSPSPS